MKHPKHLKTPDKLAGASALALMLLMIACFGAAAAAWNTVAENKNNTVNTGKSLTVTFTSAEPVFLSTDSERLYPCDQPAETIPEGGVRALFRIINIDNPDKKPWTLSLSHDQTACPAAAALRLLPADTNDETKFIESIPETPGRSVQGAAADTALRVAVILLDPDGIAQNTALTFSLLLTETVE